MDRMKTAVHESAHALVAMELDVAFHVLEIIEDPDDDCSGAVGVEGDDAFLVAPGLTPERSEQLFQEWAEQQAVIDYAGHAAVVTLMNLGDMSEESADAHGAGEDFEKARTRLAGDAARITAAKRRAVEFVIRLDADIRKVANVLAQHGRLDAQQIDFVLAYGTPRPPWLTE